MNANGQPIAYTWTEESTTGYTLSTAVSGNVTTLTNTHAPAVTDITVTIDWDDNDDQDGLRPESVTVTLSNGEKVTMTPENNWTATIENVPVYEDGEPIPYTWTEDVPEGYTATPSTTDGTTTITNVHTPATTSLTVSKVWADDDDRDLMRPSTLAVNLLANGTVIRTTTLNAVNNWSAEYDNLPVYEKGTQIVYTWLEETVNGYELSAETTGTATTLTNTHTPETIHFTIDITWDDDNNRDALRPDKVVITLTGDDGSIREVVLTEEDGWTTTLDVPANERGVPINYTWAEENIPNYRAEQTTDEDHITFINRHEPAKTALTVTKVWDDADDQDGKRPDTLNVHAVKSCA